MFGCHHLARFWFTTTATTTTTTTTTTSHGWLLLVKRAASRVIFPINNRDQSMAPRARIYHFRTNCNNAVFDIECDKLTPASLLDHLISGLEREFGAAGDIQALVPHFWLYSHGSCCHSRHPTIPTAALLVRVRLKLIRNARIKTVGNYESCMVLKLRIIFKRTRSRSRRRSGTGGKRGLRLPAFI